MKICTKCQKEKPLREFHNIPRGRKSPDGKRAQCKKCLNTRNSQYYQNNKEIVNSRSFAWAKSNPDKVKASGKLHRENNRDLILQRKRTDRKLPENKQKDKEYRDRYYLENREKEILRAIERNNRRRLKVLENTKGELATIQEMKELKDSAKVCAICKQPFDLDKHKKSFEHILPIYRGGGGELSNLTITGLRCNLSRPKFKDDTQNLLDSITNLT